MHTNETLLKMNTKGNLICGTQERNTRTHSLGGEFMLRANVTQSERATRMRWGGEHQREGIGHWG